MGWIFLTALKANIDSALSDAVLVRRVQRCSEGLLLLLLLLLSLFSWARLCATP